MRVRSFNAPDETACVRARYVYRPRSQLVHIYIYIHTYMCCTYIYTFLYIYIRTRVTAADRDGGNAMTILRSLSVMTPGPGDPEVAYAKQGTSAAREPVCGCT